MSNEFQDTSVDGVGQNESEMMYDVNPDSFSVSVAPDQRASTTAVKAVGEIAGVDPLSMKPAYDGCNFDILDRVFEWHEGEAPPVEGPVTVTIADHRVTLRPEGRLIISPPT